MSKEKELRLNGIERFSKSSQTLHLEEYSNCEVPAGCGGVVLRWINPESSRLLNTSVRLNGTGKIFLNDVLIEEEMFIPYGEYVLSIELDAAEPLFGLVQTASIDYNERLIFATVNDGTWKYSMENPANNEWHLPGFDDHHWPALIEKLLPEPGEEGTWDSMHLADMGAMELGIPENAAGSICIRKKFEFNAGTVAASHIRFEYTALGICTGYLNFLEPAMPWGFEGGYMVQPAKKPVLTSGEKDVYLRQGEHVLGFEIIPVKKGAALVCVVTDHEKTLISASLASGDWKYTLENPGKNWHSPDYDDSEWKPVEKGTFKGVKMTSRAKEAYNDSSLGTAEIITPLEKTGLYKKKTVWIRHVFLI
ncbi:MAG: hypothetical protein GY754_27915 [bacterium]|nr:hypothetical protein [bacterium]